MKRWSVVARVAPGVLLGTLKARTLAEARAMAEAAWPSLRPDDFYVIAEVEGG